jgi:hypothetical protein
VCGHLYTRLFHPQQKNPPPTLAILVRGWVILGVDLGASGPRKLTITCREAENDFSPVWPTVTAELSQPGRGDELLRIKWIKHGKQA